MTALRATTIDELCTTLGLRTPLGIRSGVALDLRESPALEPAPTAKFSDEELQALRVLAAPDAIAVVTHPTATFVIATRGPWVAEHIIEGPSHRLFVRDAINAPRLLAERSGVLVDGPLRGQTLDITVGAYRRMCELVRAGDRRRAQAALLADGVGTTSANALLDAVTARRVEITGLANDGRRFVGCDLVVVGDEATGRWLVPHDTDTSLHVRTLIEPVSSEALLDELLLIFGEV